MCTTIHQYLFLIFWEKKNLKDAELDSNCIPFESMPHRILSSK